MARSLRIFVPSAASLLTDHRGHGEGLIASSICSGLAARGHELVVCARHVDLDVKPAFQVVETGPASRWESIEPLAYARRTMRLFQRLGGAQRFDVVHWMFPQGQEEVLFSPLGSAAFVIGPHSLEWAVASKPTKAGDLVRQAIRPVSMRRHRRSLAAASAVFVSVPEASSLVPPEFRWKLRVLPFGIDTKTFRPTPLPSEPSVLFIGRLDISKGVRELLPAADRIRSELPDVRLRVAGDGPDADWLRSEANRLGVAETIELLGPVPHGEAPSLLAESSVLFAPSRGEPFGMTVLEAMACGRAVVALDEGGPRYLLDGSSNSSAPRQLVDASDRDALSDALLNLLRDREGLAAIGDANRQRVEAKFSLEGMLDELEEAYLDAAPEETRA
jgi:glycosyltransferase involved in cell wall biosynthesis